MSQTQQSGANPQIKSLDFFAWRIQRDKRVIQRQEVNRIFSGRTRLRSQDH